MIKTSKFKQKNKYFEINELIKEYKDRLIYCVIGSRGCGKSWSTQRKIINEFKEKGKQTIVLRRYVNKATEMALTYFDKILMEEFPHIKHKLEGNILYLDKEPFCLFMGLNGNSTAKGGSFPKVGFVVYEEFMPEAGERILKNEYQKLESMLISVDRFEDRLELICLGNNTSYFNPLFETLKIYPSQKAGIVNYDDEVCIIKLEPNKEFKNSIVRSKLGRLSIRSGSSVYNIDNENITNDLFNVINKKNLWDKDKMKSIFKIRVSKDKVINIWHNENDKQNYYYIDNNSKGTSPEYFYEYDFQNETNKHCGLINYLLVRKINYYTKVGATFYNTGETKYYFDQLKLFFKK